MKYIPKIIILLLQSGAYGFASFFTADGVFPHDNHAKIALALVIFWILGMLQSIDDKIKRD